VATSNLQVVISAKQTVARPAREASSELTKMARAAAEAAAGVLSIEKARIGLAVVKDVARLGADAFRLMAQNSAAMKGELGAVSSAMGKVAGSLGDTIANTRSFKALMDLVTGGMKDFEVWIKSNSKTIEDVFVGSVKYAAAAARALLFTVKGIIDLIVVAKNMVPAAQDQASSRLEEALWYARYKGLRAREALTGESTKERQQEALWMMNRAIGGVRGNMGRALDQAESEVSRINLAFDSLDDLLAKAQHAELPGGDRATKTSGGKKSGGLTEQQKALMASQKAFDLQMAQMRADSANDTNEIAADSLKAEQTAAQARLKAQEEYQRESDRLRQEQNEAIHEEIQRQLEEQQQVWTSMKDSARDAYGALSGAMASALTAFASGESGFMDAVKAQAQAVVMGVAEQAVVKAAWEAAEAVGAFAMGNVAGAVLHGKAAAMYAGVASAGYVAGSAMDSAGWDGGGGRGGAGSYASSLASSDQRVATASASAGPQVYEIHQYFQGSYATEGEAGRKIADALGIASRSSTTARGTTGSGAVSRGRG
jgi:hypothetical protein